MCVSIKQWGKFSAAISWSNNQYHLIKRMFQSQNIWVVYEENYFWRRAMEMNFNLPVSPIYFNGAWSQSTFFRDDVLLLGQNGSNHLKTDPKR